MKNRRIIVRGKVGVVVKWDPCSAAMCDAFVVFRDGSECWHSSHEFQPDDDLGPLPSREEARKVAREESVCTLREIRAQHVRDFHKAWPGAEFGKAHFGMMVDGAIGDTEEKP
jgi:hypothetical protein